LTESKIESAETKVTAEALFAQNEDLRKQLSIQQESLKTLTASLAESNAEAEVFRRKFADLESRMEAFGLASASKDRAKARATVLAAVSILRLAQKERDQLRDQFARLNERSCDIYRRSRAATGRRGLTLKRNCEKTNELVGRSIPRPRDQAPQASLMDASVLSVKDQWSFVVANIGGATRCEDWNAASGNARRAERSDVAVVDVRQRICGAVIEDSGKEKLK